MENLPTIHELRKQGYKVRVTHHKKLPEFDPYYHLASRATQIDIRDLNGNEFTAIARCSKQDEYNRKLGNKIALGRVLKYMSVFQ
jgi:hypothetical protein